MSGGQVISGTASLALLGALSGGAAMGLAGPVLVLAGFLPVIVLAAIANGAARKAVGLGGIASRLLGGFAFAVPFAALALTSRYALGWNAAGAFSGAAIAAGAGAGGLELVKAGCGKVTGLLLPGLWSAGLAAAWIWFAAALAGAAA